MTSFTRTPVSLCLLVTLVAVPALSAFAQSEQPVKPVQQQPISQNPKQATQAIPATPPTVPSKPLLPGAGTVDRQLTLPTGGLSVGTPGTATPATKTTTTQPPVPRTGPSNGTTTSQTIQLITVQPLPISRGTVAGASDAADANATGGALVIDGGVKAPAKVPGAPTAGSTIVIDGGGKPPVIVPGAPSRTGLVILDGGTRTAPVRPNPGEILVREPVQPADRMVAPGRVSEPAVTVTSQPAGGNTQVVVVTELPPVTAPTAAATTVVGAISPVGSTMATPTSSTKPRVLDGARASEGRQRAEYLSDTTTATNPGAHLGLAQISKAQRDDEENVKESLLSRLRDALDRRRDNAASTSRTAGHLRTVDTDEDLVRHDSPVTTTTFMQTRGASSDGQPAEAFIGVAASAAPGIALDKAPPSAGRPVSSGDDGTTTRTRRATPSAGTTMSPPGTMAVTVLTDVADASATGVLSPSAVWAMGIVLVGLAVLAAARLKSREREPGPEAYARAVKDLRGEKGAPANVDLGRTGYLSRLTAKLMKSEETATATPDDTDEAQSKGEGDEQSYADESLEDFSARIDRMHLFDSESEADDEPRGMPTVEAQDDVSPGEPASSVPADASSPPQLTDEDVSALIDEALRVGTPEALGFALLALDTSDPRSALLLQRLEPILADAEREEQAEALKAIDAGMLDADQLSTIAEDALAQGQLRLYVIASLAAIEKRGEPLAQQAGRIAGLVTTLRVIRDGQPSSSDGESLAPEAQELRQSRIAQTGRLLLQRQAGALLDGLPVRIEAQLGPAFDEAMRQALEDAGHAGAALGEEPTDAQLMRRQSAIASVRGLALLRAGLTVSALEGQARTTALSALLKQAEEELRAFEGRITTRDDWPAEDRERALARLNGLRVAKDAIEDLLLDAGALSADDATRSIFAHLNGANGGTGLRQRLDRADEAGRVGESRRLRDELDYLELRRIAILGRTAGADAIGQMKKIKDLEAVYWRSRDGAEAARIQASVEASRASLIPATLDAMRIGLIETGMDPEQAAQQFIRALAQVTGDDVRAGAQKWAETKALPWYRRGWIVGNYRLLHSHDIERAILADVRHAHALKLAGDHSVETLRSLYPGAYQRLVKSGVIKDGRYVIPAGFAYSPENAGSTYGQPHWLDGLNAVQFGEILVTVILPGGAAARAAGVIKAGVDASRAVRIGIGGLRLFTEATAFTGLSRGAQRLLHGPQTDERPFSADVMTNLAIIGGLRAFHTLFQLPERALLGRAAARHVTGGGRHALTAAQTDAAISRMLWGSATKPLSQLTRAELTALGTKLGLETVKIGAEAGAFTAFDALPIVGHGGHLDGESFRDNLLFVGQMRALHLTGAYGIDRARRALSRRMRPDATATVTPEAPALIAEAPESPAGAAAKARFRNWYRAMAKQIPLRDPVKLADFVRQEFQRIADNTPWSKEKREAARSMALLLESGRVKIEFTSKGKAFRGNYDPFTRTAHIHTDAIIVGLYNRMVQTRGRQPKASEVLQSLLGTTVHEALEHGLQGLDAHTPARGDGPLATAPRPYSKLHEARSFWVQRLFDPTLGGKNRNYRRGKAVKLADVIEVVDRNYGDVQRANLEILQQRYPDRVPRWKAVEKRLGASLEARLRSIDKEGLTGDARVAAIDKARAKVRAARAAAMSIIFRTHKTAPVSGAVARLRRVRKALQRSGRRAAGDQPVPAWAAGALRRFITDLGIDWKPGERFGQDQQQALHRLLVERFRRISTQQGVSAELRAAATEMVVLLEGEKPLVRTQFLDRASGKEAGAYFPSSRIAEVYLRSIAATTERVAQKAAGRVASGRDFLRVLMGVTVHEVLEHGFRQQLGIHRDQNGPVLGTRPSTRLQELRAFLTQRLFDREVGDVLRDVPEAEVLDALSTWVDRQYNREPMALDNEKLLFDIDRTDGANWLVFRKRFDDYFGGRQAGAVARALMIEALDALPLSAEQRGQFNRLLARHDGAGPVRAEEFDPLGDSLDTQARGPGLAAGEPALTPEMLKAGMLEDLIFTRTSRVGSPNAFFTRRAINRLRQGTWPGAPEGSPMRASGGDKPAWPGHPETPEVKRIRARREAERRAWQETQRRAEEGVR